MASIEIDASELNQLAVDFGKGAAVAPKLTRLVVQKTCADIKADGQMLAPVDTGFLRSSITYETHETAGGAWGEVGPTALYGGMVESGTSRMAPRAYMGPAFDRRVPEFIAALEQIADKTLG